MPAIITVEGSDSSLVAGDGVCSIREAIHNANSNSDTSDGDCAAGDDLPVGGDTIMLTTDVTLSVLDHFHYYNPDSASGLPAVVSDIKFDGNGHYVTRDSDSDAFGIFDVDTGGVLTIRNTTVSGGDTYWGAGIYNYAGALTVVDSTVSGNNSETFGGGILSRSGILVVMSTTVSGNSSGFEGGGIAVDGDVATISNSSVSGNSCIFGYGGGVFNAGSSIVTITDSVVSGNVGGAGGGLGNREWMTLINTTVSGNSGWFGGGIDTISGGITTLINSTVSGNIATYRGGGLYGLAGTTTNLTNVTVSGNSAELAGGGILDYGVTNLTNSTVFGGSAPLGGGIRTTGVTTLSNSIVAGSLAGGDCSGTVVDGTGNFSEDGSCPGATILPELDFDAVLADNGGPTETHRLLPGSVATEAAGDCTLRTDQRGFIRGQACDSGAYEFDALPAPVLTISGDCPGVVTVAISGATPGGRLRLAGSDQEGNSEVPGGPCAGARLDLADPIALASVEADRNGDVLVSRVLGAEFCGLVVQAVDRATCTGTNPARVPILVAE